MARSGRRHRRDLPDLVFALDEHLYLLRQAYRRVVEDAAHATTIGGELRTLVCYVSGQDGLLWRVANTVGVSDAVRVAYAPPPIDPAGPRGCGLGWSSGSLRWPWQGSPRSRVIEPSLRRLVREAPAYSHERGVLTFEEIIRSVAGSLGVHESPNIDQHLQTFRSLHIGGLDATRTPMTTLAPFVLAVGARVARSAAATLALTLPGQAVSGSVARPCVP